MCFRFCFRFGFSSGFPLDNLRRIFSSFSPVFSVFENSWRSASRGRLGTETLFAFFFLALLFVIFQFKMYENGQASHSGRLFIFRALLRVDYFRLFIYFLNESWTAFDVNFFKRFSTLRYVFAFIYYTLFGVMHYFFSKIPFLLQKLTFIQKKRTFFKLIIWMKQKLNSNKFKLKFTYAKYKYFHKSVDK